MTARDVTNVEYSRMLKRNGVPQESQAYWQGLIPSLTTIHGMTAIAVENKNKMRWILVIGKPAEPNASAFTLQELQDYLKNYMATHKTEKEFPIVRKEGEVYICSIGGQDMFNALTEPDVLAQAVLYIMKL